MPTYYAERKDWMLSIYNEDRVRVFQVDDYHELGVKAHAEGSFWNSEKHFPAKVQSVGVLIAEALSLPFEELSARADGINQRLDEISPHDDANRVDFKLSGPLISQASDIGKALCDLTKTTKCTVAAVQLLGLDVPEECIHNKKKHQFTIDEFVPKIISESYVETNPNTLQREMLLLTLRTQSELERFSKKADEFESLDKDYRQKIATVEARDFWANRARTTARNYKLANILFIIVLGLSIFAVPMIVYHSDASLVRSLIALFHTEKVAAVYHESGTTAPAGFDAISVILPLLFFLIWLLRHLAKIRSEERRLYVDALHRHAMVDTFMSMAVEPNVGLKNEERQFMMEALFRPIDYGPEEEARPPSLKGATKILDK